MKKANVNKKTKCGHKSETEVITRRRALQLARLKKGSKWVAGLGKVSPDKESSERIVRVRVFQRELQIIFREVFLDKSSIKERSSKRKLHLKKSRLQPICYSHWANGAQNGVISIWQWGVFTYEKGAI